MSTWEMGQCHLPIGLGLAKPFCQPSLRPECWGPHPHHPPKKMKEWCPPHKGPFFTRKWNLLFHTLLALQRSQNHCLQVPKDSGPPPPLDTNQFEMFENSHLKKTDISQTSLLLKWNNLACWCTSCSSRIVFSSTNVVFRVFVQILRIHGIGVDHENIHGETGINEIHMLTPICSRKSPTGGFPGVSNLLIPAVVKDSASPVMISKHAEPNLQGNNPEKKTNRNKSIKPLGTEKKNTFRFWPHKSGWKCILPISYL